jgi:hypothetical protein
MTESNPDVNAEIETEENEQPLESLNDLQVSSKSGSHSTAQKRGASRLEFFPRPSAGPVSAAFGSDQIEPGAAPKFRCNACGRFFDDEFVLRAHETECRTAKLATREGASELEREDHMPHPPDDRGI